MEKKLRKDLNDIVLSIGLKKIKTRYNERNVCLVQLFNGETVEFKDSEGLYDLFMSYKKCGKVENLVKSRQLVEEFRTDSSIDGIIDESTGTYICVLYELNDGSKFRLFPNRFVDLRIIDNYYNLYKEQKSQKNKTQA